MEVIDVKMMSHWPSYLYMRFLTWWVTTCKYQSFLPMFFHWLCRSCRIAPLKSFFSSQPSSPTPRMVSRWQLSPLSGKFLLDGNDLKTLQWCLTPLASLHFSHLGKDAVDARCASLSRTWDFGWYVSIGNNTSVDCSWIEQLQCLSSRVTLR